MRLEGEQVLCRFHMSNYVQVHHQPLYEWLVERARCLGLAGATVLRGRMGFCRGGRLLVERMWSLSQEVPVIVEVVDSLRAVESLLRDAAPYLGEGLVTLERAHVLYYRAAEQKSVFWASRLGMGPPPRLDAPGDPVEGGWTMTQVEEGVLLRIFVGDAAMDPETRRPLYEALVLRAREEGLWGATVLRGTLGFGKHSRLHAAKLLEASTDLPVIVEIVDTEARIQAFLPQVDQRLTEGLVTMEKVRILRGPTGKA